LIQNQPDNQRQAGGSQKKSRGLRDSPHERFQPVLVGQQP